MSEIVLCRDAKTLGLHQLNQRLGQPRLRQTNSL